MGKGNVGSNLHKSNISDFQIQNRNLSSQSDHSSPKSHWKDQGSLKSKASATKQKYREECQHRVKMELWIMQQNMIRLKLKSICAEEPNPYTGKGGSPEEPSSLTNLNRDLGIN